MIDSLYVQRRRHHGHLRARHHGLEDVFGRVDAAGDGEIGLDVAVEDCDPVKTEKQFFRGTEVQAGHYVEVLDVEVRLIEAVEEHESRLLRPRPAALRGWECWCRTVRA